ncbi:MAG: pilus assembly protein TadG-related protein [Sulfitobacter sp.]
MSALTLVLGRYRRAEDGAVLAIVAVALAVMMGFLALTFDFGRLATTQSELQSFVDNVALSAAGELDGRPDAITRAVSAAEQMISDTHTFGQGENLLSGASDFDIAFYVENPAANSAASPTTNPRETGFVQITSKGETVELGFAAAFSELTGNDASRNDVGAQAVAGFTQSACDITPVMFCVPDSDWKADDNVGTSVLLRTGGNNAGWGPGAFGFIDPSSGLEDNNGTCAGLNGSNLDTCLIAATQERTACFDSTGVNVRTGQSVGVFEAALNIRFDIFLASAQSLRNDPLFAPAPNVISGYVGARNGRGGGNSAVCVAQTGSESPNSIGLLEDDCHASGGCGRFGNADWSTGRRAYVEANYGGVDPHPTATTRYEYYLAEIAAAGGGASTSDILSGRAETGRPQCSRHQSTDPNRRVLVAAGIDCSANSLSGNGGNNIPVKEFVEIFMIRPIGLDGTRDFYVEVIGGAGGGQGGTGDAAIVRDVVRLYK